MSASNAPTTAEAAWSTSKMQRTGSTGRLRRGLGIALVVVVLVAIGHTLRTRTGLELSPDTLRAFVDRQGAWAPIVFVLLVTFRQFLLIPSGFLLGAGGLLFGAVQGTLLGTLGLLVSTVFLYVLARGLVGDRVRRRLAQRYPRIERSVESSGPLVLFLTMAYPLGAITLVAVAAGLSSMRLGVLVFAATLGGAVRAATYSFVGSNLLRTDSPGFWLSVGLLTLATLAPLAHPKLRRRLLGAEDPS